MAITYTWKVTGMKTMNAGDLTKAVFQTYWTKTGTDESGNTGVFSGATPFNIESIDPNSFINFDELTEEIVLDWIRPVVVGTYEEHVNAQIAKQIAEKYSKPEEAKLPWAPEAVTPGTPIPAQQPK